MKQDARRANTMEDLLRGPFIRPSDPEKGITAIDFVNAIDLHVIPPLVHAYSDLVELCDGLNEQNRQEAGAHLSTIRNSIAIIARMGEEIV